MAKKTPTKAEAAKINKKAREVAKASAKAKQPKAPKADAEEWLTPTQISKEEGMPKHALQLIYGYIRTGKLEARDGGKSKLVSPAAARELIANRGSRGGARTPRTPRQPRAGQELPAGTILSEESTAARNATSRTPKGKRSLDVVTHHVGSLTYSHDGEKDRFWQTESLAKRIKDGTTQIESPANLLAIVAYHWRANDEAALAQQLMEWCSGRVNDAGNIYNRLIGLKAEELEMGREEASDEG